jgi:hypothetical protein
MISSADLPSETALISLLSKSLDLFRDFLSEHFYFIIAIVIYISSVWIVAWYHGVEDMIRIGLYSEKYALLIFLYIYIFLIGHALYVMVFVRPNRLAWYILNDLKAKYITPKRIINAIPVLIVFQILSSTYTSLKAMIPVINPYSWDPFFIHLDAIIHFGKQPCQLLNPIFGYPLVTYAFDFIYHSWFFVIIFVLYQQIFSLRDQKLRMQFLLATIGVASILGGLFAIFFSSVGPCFYGKLTGDYETFGPLMQYLYSAAERYHIIALDSQEYLWENFTSKKIAIGSGISAMPSMHVAKIFLIVLLTWQKNQILAAIFSVYTLFIMVGSVHLGWHYAVDGYLSIIVTLIIWVICGQLSGSINFSEKIKNIEANRCTTL